MGLLAGFAAVEIIQITGNKIKESHGAEASPA
jgi:hypothetical protein